MPQAVPVSTCQRIISQTGCGTDILATVGQVIIVLEAIVLWTGKATLPLVAASFSLGLHVGDASPDALCLAAQRASPGPTRPALRAVGDSGQCERTATSACFTPGPSHLETARIEGIVVGINTVC